MLELIIAQSRPQRTMEEGGVFERYKFRAYERGYDFAGSIIVTRLIRTMNEYHKYAVHYETEEIPRARLSSIFVAEKYDPVHVVSFLLEEAAPFYRENYNGQRISALCGLLAPSQTSDLRSHVSFGGIAPVHSLISPVGSLILRQLHMQGYLEMVPHSEGMLFYRY